MKSVLLHYAESRKEESFPQLFYDYESNVNYIKSKEDVLIPFIEAKNELRCITTKTEAYREADDSLEELLCLQTKTFAERESDDHDSYYH